MNLVAWLSLGAGVLGLLFSAYLIMRVRSAKGGTDAMEKIARAIREGSNAYLWRQYKVIAIFAVIIFALLWWWLGFATGISFVVGAVLSALAGYIGMSAATRANVKTTAAAQSGLKAAMKVAFQGGSVTGFAIVGLGLLGVAAFYLIYGDPIQFIGFGFGASLISLFARVGGGIFTKAADVGADLVGKVEAGIPEDDPRNPAVIADNVGDNVGDTAGMGADLFETYVVTIIAAMLLGVAFTDGVIFPLALGAIAIVASIVGSFFVRLRGNKIMGALYKGVYVTIALAAVAFYFLTDWFFNGDIRFFWSALIGLGVTLAMIFITDYYTSTRFKPVKEIAKASETGSGTNIISGIAIGLNSTVMPTILILVAILLAFFFGGGLYGIAIAAVAMLSTTGLIVAIDSFGPITDNAGGIAEMTQQPEDVRENTDALDAVGNTTKAVTKGYAIGSAALAALALFAAYTGEVMHAAELKGVEVFEVLDISSPLVLIGAFIGAVLPFLFSANLMRAVGRAAFKVVENVRKQFSEKKILEGEDQPDYGQTVDIVTKAAQKHMIVPAIISVVVPLLVGFILGPAALGGLLVGVILTGFLMALFMATGGAAWDNAKKLIETGEHGGKGSEAHKAAVVGDTVGDPFKDTAGPALNSLIKVINTIAIIFAILIVQFHLFGV